MTTGSSAGELTERSMGEKRGRSRGWMGRRLTRLEICTTRMRGAGVRLGSLLAAFELAS